MCPKGAGVKTEQTRFRQTALSSGLVSRDDLDEAEALVRASLEASGVAVAVVGDLQLASQLIELDRLNRWQAEQLLAGRSRFHLGPYRVLDSLGQGGMGQVFKAEHTIMGRIVAIKVLPRHKSTDEAVNSFLREIRAQAQLDHENLVRALDAGHDGNVHYLVTEYVPGTDLRRLVRQGGVLDVAMAASIVTQAARGLEHAHHKGLIHRDVKPGNLLVTPEGRVKVSDLGLVGYFGEGVEADQRAAIVGTADYLAPEQISTPQRVSPVSDIYALGCTLYYAVTGKVPFPGGTTRDKIAAHLNLQPIDPRRINPALPSPFVDVIADMMAKKPEKRLADAAQVIERLTPWVREPAVALLAQRLERLPSTVPPPPLRVPPPVVRSQLRDTDPDTFLPPDIEPKSDESQSQVSQRTHPLSAAEEETLPSLEPHVPVAEQVRERRQILGVAPWLFAVAAIGATVAAVSIAATLLSALLGAR